MVKSWRTTLCGVLTVIVSVATAAIAFFDADPTTVPDFTLVTASLMAGLGLIFARDNKVSSEAAGVVRELPSALTVEKPK